MSGRPSPEFQSATIAARAAYDFDHTVDTGDAPEIGSILVVQRPGYFRSPLLAIFPDYKMSKADMWNLERFVSGFLPKGRFIETAKSEAFFRGVFNQEQTSWQKILLGGEQPQPRAGFAPEVTAFSSPDPKDIGRWIDPQLANLINEAQRIEIIGKGRQIVELAKPEFRHRLNGVMDWYADPNIGVLRDSLDVSTGDYRKWTQKLHKSEKGGVDIDPAWRYLRQRIAEPVFGGEVFKRAKGRVTERITDKLQPWEVEEVSRSLVAGVEHPWFSNTQALELAVKRLDRFNATDKRLFFQITGHYQPLVVPDLIDRITSPVDTRVPIMRQRMHGLTHGDPGTGLFIAAAELTRQAFIAELP